MVKEVLKKHPFLMIFTAKAYNLIHRNNAWRYRLNNSIRTRGAFLKNVKFKISGRNNSIWFGPMARLRNCTINILGDNCEIRIGGGSTIVSHSEIHCQDNNSRICIGKHFTMEGGHIASTEGELIEIGEDCMFSGGIEIRNGDSHVILEIETGKRINWAETVTIGNHVWLTSLVKVMKGSFIASDSIVGNSSVVAGRLEKPHCIYAGIPAKLVKENIDWDRFRKNYTR